MERRSRFNLVASVATLAVCLGLVAGGDRTSWSQGFGFDGRTYGDLAQHFPGAVFGDEGVTPPGYGPFKGKRPQGIDAYYVRRILPSAVVYYSLTALGLEKSPHNVIICFGVWDALLISLAVLFWCLCADLLEIGMASKLLGLAALLLSFSTLKGAFYFPVITDTFAFAFGAASLYFWLTRRTAALALVTFLGAFTWPTELLLGVILIAFPPRCVPLTGGSLSLNGERRESTVRRLAVAAVPAIALLAYLVYLRATDYSPPEGVPLGGAFALSAAFAAGFIFIALLWLVPDLRSRQMIETVRTLKSGRTVLAVGLVAVVVLLQAAIARRTGVYDELDLLRSSLFYSAANPLLFVVAAVGFFGPALALAISEWPQICRKLHEYGPGATIAAAYFLAILILTEPRKLVGIYPFLVLFIVLAAAPLTRQRLFMPIFLVASLAVSRVWLPIGSFPLISSVGLQDFPAQRYYLSSGIWTSSSMYFVQLAVTALLVLTFVFIKRGMSRPVIAAAADAPPGAPN